MERSSESQKLLNSRKDTAGEEAENTEGAMIGSYGELETVPSPPLSEAIKPLLLSPNGEEAENNEGAAIGSNDELETAPSPSTPPNEAIKPLVLSPKETAGEEVEKPMVLSGAGWLLSLEDKVDNSTLGQGVMLARFNVLNDPNPGRDTLLADFADSAIGRVPPIDSGLCWITLLRRSYTQCTRYHNRSELPQVQPGTNLILSLCMSDGLDTFRTLPCSMIERRMVQVFVSDIFPAVLDFPSSRLEIVHNFLLKTLHLQGWDEKVDNFTPGQSVMLASFKVLNDPNQGKDTLLAGFAESAIGRVPSAGSGFHTFRTLLCSMINKWMVIGLLVMYVHPALPISSEPEPPPNAPTLVIGENPTMLLLSKIPNQGIIEVLDLSTNETSIVEPEDPRFDASDLLSYDFDGWLLLKWEPWLQPESDQSRCYYYYNVVSGELIELPEIDLMGWTFGAFEGSPNTEANLTVVVRFLYTEVDVAVSRGGGAWTLYQFACEVGTNMCRALRVVDSRVFWLCGFFLYCWSEDGLQWQTALPVPHPFTYMFCSSWIAEHAEGLFLVLVERDRRVRVLSILDGGAEGGLEEIDDNLPGTAYGQYPSGGKLVVPRLPYETNRIFSAGGLPLSCECLEICTEPVMSRVVRECQYEGELGNNECDCSFAWVRVGG